MTIAAEHERIVTPEFVGVDNAPTPNSFDREVHKCTGRDVSYNLDFDNAISLQDAQNRDFSCGPPAALSLASATEVALVHLDHAAQELRGIGGAGCNCSPDQGNGFEDRRVTETGLLGNLPGRKLELEELYYPEPCFVRDTEFVEPPPSKIMEGIPTPLASEPFTNYTIDFVTPAPRAETTVVFPTQSCQKEPGRILKFYKGFE